MTSARFPFVVPVVVLLLTLAGRPGSLGAKPGSSPIRTVKVAEEPVVQRLELTGSVMARRQARLSSRASGLIQKMVVDAGSVVKAGDLLMELDPALAQFALQRIQAEADQAAAEREEAERRVEEVRELVKVGGFSKSEAETRETAVRVQAAALQKARAQLEEQKEIITRHRLVAPFDGVIRAKLAEEGEWVQTGTPVVELVETGHVHVDVQAPQEWSGTLREDEGLTVTVKLDAYADRMLKAAVATRVPVKDPVARTFLLRLKLDDADKLATPGMSARVQLHVQGKDKSLLVPRDALVLSTDGSARIWVLQERGEETATVTARSVKTGPTMGQRVVVTEGLEPGARVVVQGNESLTEGQTVLVLE